MNVYFYTYFSRRNMYKVDKYIYTLTRMSYVIIVKLYTKKINYDPPPLPDLNSFLTTTLFNTYL